MTAPRRALPAALAAPLVAVTLAGALAASCGPDLSRERRGGALVDDPGFADSAYNTFACTTCHLAPATHRAPRGDAGAGAAVADRIYPGAPLAGVASRPSYWGGAVRDLHEAVNLCYVRFMRGRPLSRTSDDSVALYAYLASLDAEPGAITAAIPFTVPRRVNPPAMGNAANGAALYTRACFHCHGEVRTGAGRFDPTIVVVPDATEMEHTAPEYTEESLRQVLVQKTRHGSFLSFGGVMPPFSLELLSDQDVADIVAHMNPVLRTGASRP